jgi:hypothetical protein
MGPVAHLARPTRILERKIDDEKEAGPTPLGPAAALAAAEPRLVRMDS